MATLATGHVIHITCYFKRKVHNEGEHTFSLTPLTDDTQGRHEHSCLDSPTHQHRTNTMFHWNRMLPLCRCVSRGCAGCGTLR
ncbi:hypothetical protein K439DRAFT_339250 [Ramaria rubella]|nr:hypothetical protein K439DRAFT_339250 [Ramaria rubella]